jgi:hypothetical protein
MFDLLQAVVDGIGLLVEAFSLLETAWSLLLDIGQALRWLWRRARPVPVARSLPQGHSFLARSSACAKPASE